MHRFRHLALLLLAGVLLSGPLQAGTSALTNKRMALHGKVAAAGNAATVGIYCKRGPFEGYYGTGVVISADGYILTSTTVVPPAATDIHIHFTDHTRRDATIVELDEAVEATLLKVEAKKLPFLPVAAELPKIGERAYSFGNAHSMIRLGESASFSVGIVSGVYPVKSADSQSSYAGLAIETDAAINPGQDGGPLLNSRGQLVGIISLSYSDTRWQGMAVPITKIRATLPSLCDNKVRLSTKAIVRPLAEDTADGSPFIQDSKDLVQALVGLTVERTYSMERLPRYNWGQYKKSFEGWDKFDERRKAIISQDFFTAERILGANQQLRRPDTPVTGLLISADGLILTSAFNLNADPVFVHKKDGVKPVKYEGSVRALTMYNRNDYKLETNKVKSVTARLHDGRTFKAKIVATHRPLGVALLQIEAEDLPHVDLEKRMRQPAFGQAVGVLGLVEENHSYTLNTGVVSAPDRQRGMHLQFDALLNYGNSGGPVFTCDGGIVGLAIHPMRPDPFMGRVLGLLELQRWQIAPNSGLGFAARMDRILAALPGLKEGKSVNKLKGAFVGVEQDRRQVFANQVVIGRVQKDSPADKAGLRRGDIVLKLDGVELRSWKDFIAEIAKHHVDDTVQLTIKRKGGRKYLEVDGKKVEREQDLQELFKSLKDGQEIKARYVRIKEDVFDIPVTLGERK